MKFARYADERPYFFSSNVINSCVMILSYLLAALALASNDITLSSALTSVPA